MPQLECLKIQIKNCRGFV